MNRSNPSADRSSDWYYADHGQAVGPFAWYTLEQLLRGGVIAGDTLVRSTADEKWRPLQHCPEVTSRQSASTAFRSAPSSDSPQTLQEEPSAVFGVHFGSAFIPTSCGFRGAGSVECSAQSFRVKGRQAFPVALEYAAGLTTIFLCAQTTSVVIRAVVVLLVVAAYNLLKKEQTFSLSEIAGLRRQKKRLQVTFKKGRPVLKLRVDTEINAQKLAEYLSPLSV